MPDAVAIISGKIAAMFLLMAAGSAFYRAKFLNDAGVSQTSGLVLYVANPIFIAEAPMELFGAALLMDVLWVALGTAVWSEGGCSYSAVCTAGLDRGAASALISEIR